MSNLFYENIGNHYLDEDTVTPEEILPDDKWVNGYPNDLELETGMTSAAREASQRKRAKTDGDSCFIRTNACRAIPVTERAVQLKLARKMHGKRLCKKDLEGLYEVLAPGSNILNVSPSTSTIKEPGKPTVTLCNSDIAEFGTTQERKTPLKFYADKRGPRTCEKLVKEQIQSHIKQFTRKLKGDKK